jgi:FKBP-type peptidyl-prolyl cis-trans isomerase
MKVITSSADPPQQQDLSTIHHRRPIPQQASNMKITALHLRFTIACVAMTASHLVLGWAPPSSSSKSSSFQKHRHPSAVTVALHSSSTNENANVNSNDRPICWLDLDRRSVLATFVSATFALSNACASPVLAAASSSTSSNAKPQEFTNVSAEAPAPAGETPFRTLPSGVQIKDFRVGAGDATVTLNSPNVAIQCSGRLLNLNGVVFYNTKNNNPDGFGAIPLTVDLGKGQMLPGLEQGLVGMKKGGIRRIIVPQNLAYNQFPDLEPKPMTATEQRALDSVVKNPRRDGTILFDVQVERVK